MDQALQSECGVAIAVSDPDALRRACYAARNEFRNKGNTRYDQLSFRNAPSGRQELWIVREAI